MSDCTHPMDAIVAPVATVGMFRIGGMPHCGLCGCPVALAVDGLHGGYLQAIGEPNELVLDQGDPRPMRAALREQADSVFRAG